MTKKTNPQPQAPAEEPAEQTYFSPEVGVVKAATVEEAGDQVRTIKGKQE